MAEFSIDQSNLPAVNAVCRQFAVREDHSLAHNLQEQEIEHHLASNVQRNRLVQNDLQVAKKLQEEENRKAQIRLQRHQREMEHHDNQMAQVIQDELSLENEKRRRQEEKDEAIARKLQEKEEKLRRKHQQAVDREPSEAVFEGNGGHVKSRVHKPDRSSRLASGCHRGRDTGDSLLRGAVGGSSSKVQANDLAPEPATRGSTERLHCPEADCEDSHPDSGRHKVEGFSPKKEPPMRPPPPVINPSSSYHGKGARPKVVGPRDGSHNSPDRGAHRQKHRDRAGRDCSPEVLGACGYNADELRGRQGADGDGGKRRKARSRSRDLQLSEEECSEQGLKPRIEYGVNDAMHGISRMTTKDLEWKDAELARKLQEEEIRATQISERAAQLAQDEEIARLLTEDEKKQVHRKSKEKDSARRAEEDRRKGSSDWRKHEVERKVTCTVHDTSEYVKPRWDELESPTVKPERPARLPAHRAGSEDLDHRLSSQRPSRPGPRSAESSQKVSYYRQ
ncbi:coiled-coil domain-containing protein 50 isoform X1 [Amblyraja radiata]|uniref:coiled-coil domain-containing protein 50 isoform X1 n=1 Tax=Amblyraja radiata TaxID=386614 RepID=UPI001402C5F3|nr:coiled-coil domain-containing protein 50 isoform X1 [Amblyraja radiata]